MLAGFLQLALRNCWGGIRKPVERPWFPLAYRCDRSLPDGLSQYQHKRQADNPGFSLVLVFCQILISGSNLGLIDVCIANDRVIPAGA